MTNLHVLLVSFPIALLIAYGLVDLPLERLRRLSFWFPLKAFLVIAGTLFGYAAAIAGLLARKSYAVGALERWVRIHIYAAVSTLLLATLISLLHLAAIRLRMRPDTTSRLLGRLARVAESRAMVLAGLTALFAVFFTGAIGGIISLGPDNDWFTRALYRWLK